MDKSLGIGSLAALVILSLTACTVTGPEVRIRPPIHIDVGGGGHDHHHRHHHDHDD